MNLSGNKSVDIEILNRLDDKDLTAACKVNQYVQNLCKDETLWLNRIIEKYGKDALKGKGNITYRDYYTSGKAKAYVLCAFIQKMPHRSRMVIDDFYNPYAGLISAFFTKDNALLDYLMLKIVLFRIQTSQKKMTEFAEEKLKKAIDKAYNTLPEYRRDDLKPDEELTDEEKEKFVKTIDVSVGRPNLLKITASSNPSFVKALGNKPEEKFKFLIYIHDGFRSKQIPIDILWDELCFVPYVLDYTV